jgi:hypothetical protein
MNDDLAQQFENFLGGACQPDDFERQLLALCRADPKHAWRALALLDQYYRRHRISEALWRHVRQNIGPQAMRLEGHTVPPERPVPPAFTVTAETSMEEALADVEALLTAPPTPARPAASIVPPATAVPPPALTVPPATTRPAAAMTPMAEQYAQPAASAGDRPQAGRIRWARGFQTSPALGLIAVVLGGVAASTRVQHVPAPSAAGNDAIPVASAPALPGPEASPGPGVISLSSDRYLVYPHQRTLEFTVERTTGGAGDAGFVWWTQPAGAKSSEDYIGTRARPAALPNGSGALKLQVPILANPRRRHIEMFYVVIGKLDGSADLGSIHRATVFILPADST